MPRHLFRASWDDKRVFLANDGDVNLARSIIKEKFANWDGDEPDAPALSESDAVEVLQARQDYEPSDF